MRGDVGAYLGAPVRVMGNMPVPEDSRDPGRRQNHSTVILREMIKDVPPDALKLLGVTERDLFVPILTFVFGEAQLGGRAAVVSLARLRQEFHGLQPDAGVLRERLRKESLHELGHTFGLTHCASLECVMYLSNSVGDVDKKGADFCAGCRPSLKAGGR